MTWKKPSIILVLLILASGAGLYLSFPREKSEKGLPSRPPLILLFSCDTLRADHLSCYGYPRQTSPHIDRFARDSVLFSRAISQSHLTAPGHMSIFTSLTPDVHLVNNPNDKNCDLFNRLGDGVPTLAELIKRQGYTTAGIHGGGCVSEDFGFARGFDSYSDDFFFNFQTTYYQPEKALQTIREKIRKQREEGKPLFLFLHHYICHHPYLHAPPEFNLKFLADPVEGLPLSSNDLLKNTDQTWGPYDENSFWRNVDLSNPEHRNHIVALYDGNILYSDFIFQKVVDILKEENLYNDALIVLTSDHGEEFYEHGGSMHQRLFIEDLHVPLIVKFPGNRYSGTKVPETVRTLDILPTICHYLNVPPPDPIQGVSLLPLLTGEGVYQPPIMSFSLNYRGPETREMTVSTRLAKNGYAYSDLEWQGEKEWLFDVETDPVERRNLAIEQPRLREKLRAEVAELTNDHQKLRDSLRGDEPKAVRLDEPLRRQLKALGYTQ